MFDSVSTEGAAVTTPSQIELTPLRCAEGIYPEPPADTRISVNESRRRTCINVAAGRIAWVIVPKDAGLQPIQGGVWRGVTHDELRESLLADVTAYREAEADHKEAGREKARRKSSLRSPARKKKLFGLFGRDSEEADDAELVVCELGAVPFRSVPMITFSVEQLDRGLELMTEQGLIRKEESGGVATYFVQPLFFENFKIAPAMEKVTEP